MDNIFSVYVWNLSYNTSVNRKKLLDVTTDFFLSLLNPNFLVCCEVQEKTEKKIPCTSHSGYESYRMMQRQPNPMENMMS